MSSTASGLHHSPCVGPLQEWFHAPEWYVQQANWIMHPESVDSVAHNYQLALRINGTLNKSALVASLEEITRRHEPLRSAFRVVGDRVLQNVSLPRPFCMREHSLRKLESHNAERALAELTAREITTPFDFGEDGLLRGVLYEVAADEYLLQLVSHRIAFDDWSEDVFLNELFLLYKAYVEGMPVQLVNITSTYSAFARDLESGERRAEVNRQILFWKQKLAGFVADPSLTRKPCGLMSTIRAGQTETLELPADFNRHLEDCAREHRMSAFMILVGALQVSLSRQSNTSESAVVCCVANRDSVELENLIGPFSNRIILRSEFSGQGNPHQLLQRIRDAALEAYSATSPPYGELLKALFPNAVGGNGGSVRIAVTARREGNSSRQVGGISVETVAVEDRTACYDLFVTVRFIEQKSMCVDFRYDADNIDSDTVRQLLNGIKVSLGEIVRQAHSPRVMPLTTEASEKTQGVTERRKSGSLSRPQSQVETRLQKLWQEVLERGSVEVDQNFFALGGDSLKAARLFSRIQAVFGKKLAVTAILEKPTVRTLAQLLIDDASRSAQPSLVRLKSSGTRPPIYCIHAREGDVLSFRNFPKYVENNQPLFGLQSQAVAGGKPHFSVEAMAQHYISEIKRVQPKGPYSFFGYCFGGSVAFAMALRLQREGETVAFLGMFYTSPPGSLGNVPFPSAPLLREKIWRKWRQMSYGGAGARIQTFLRALSYLGHMMYASAQVDGWRLIAKGLGSRAANWLGRSRVNVHYLNVAAAKDYQPNGIFQGRVTFFLPVEIPYEYTIQPAGWARFTTEGVQTIKVKKQGDLSDQEEFARQIANHFNIA